MFLGKDDFVDFSEGEDDLPEQIGDKKPQNQNQNQQNSNQNQNKITEKQNTNKWMDQDEVEDLDQSFPIQKQQQQLNLKKHAQSTPYQPSQSLYKNQTQDVLDLDNDSQTLGSSQQTNNTINDKMQKQQENLKKRMQQYGRGATLQQKKNNETNNYYDDIKFDQLQELDAKNGYMHEPGYNYNQNDDLPVLSQQDNKFKVKEQQNIGNLKIEDSEKHDELVKQKEEEKKNVDKNKLQQLKMGLIKDIISDEDSDEEEDVKNEEITDELKKKKIEHQNDDEDEENQAAQIQQIKQEETKQQEEEEEEESSDEEEDDNDKMIIAKPVDNLQIGDMREFLTRPLPKGLLLQCCIKRDKSGLNHFHPKYHVFLSSGFKHIMSGKKRSGCNTSNYLMGMDKNKLDRKSEGFLGKVRSNFLGTEFHVYDTGDNPKEAKDISKIRKELAIVIYESNLLGAKGPRKMRAMIPAVDKQSSAQEEWKPLSQNESMLAKFKQSNLDKMHLYYNKPPKWNDHVQAFVLNFNGRVDKPSVKNFQLVNDENEDIVYLQFGRVGEDVFNMDLQWPMSPIQAFGICLSSFDYKIACE